MNMLRADRQGITRAGLMFLIEKMGDCRYKYVEDKAELMAELELEPVSVVVLDYTLFDIADADELRILNQRFPQTHWLLFCEELSVEFIRYVIAVSPQFSVLLKDSPLSEITEALRFVTRHHRYICQQVTEMLLTTGQQADDKPKLTKTETEILRDIAMGMKTKEIADKRFSSFHTVNTHRKNIFRKLKVNTAHEATRYALRAGLIDASDYYI